MQKLIVFIGSVAVALLALLLERLAGIDWDFHPDSVTYATTSIDVVNSILSQDLMQIFNNGYYFWAALLDMNVTAMITTNVILFAITNVIIFQFHNENCKYDNMKIKWISALALILLNPYRIHLATTPLKDTMILLFVTIIAVYNMRGALIFPVLFALRVASSLYIIAFIGRRRALYVLAAVLLICLVAGDIVTARLMEFNAADMQLREFDKIPNFRDLGLIGVVLRGALWPLLAISGLFAVISPAFAFFAVAIGSVTNQIYCKMVLGRFQAPIAVFVPIAIFAMMVTGYTAYIRYVYPLLALIPVFAIQEEISKRDHKQNYAIYFRRHLAI